jgi:hypothetical protein
VLTCLTDQYDSAQCWAEHRAEARHAPGRGRGASGAWLGPRGFAAWPCDWRRGPSRAFSPRPLKGSKLIVASAPPLFWAWLAHGGVEHGQRVCRDTQRPGRVFTEKTRAARAGKQWRSRDRAHRTRAVVMPLHGLCERGASSQLMIQMALRKLPVARHMCGGP